MHLYRQLCPRVAEEWFYRLLSCLYRSYGPNTINNILMKKLLKILRHLFCLPPNASESIRINSLESPAYRNKISNSPPISTLYQNECLAINNFHTVNAYKSKRFALVITHNCRSEKKSVSLCLKELSNCDAKIQNFTRLCTVVHPNIGSTTSTIYNTDVYQRDPKIPPSENSTHVNSTQRKFHPPKIPPSENSTQRKLG